MSADGNFWAFYRMQLGFRKLLHVEINERFMADDNVTICAYVLFYYLRTKNIVAFMYICGWNFIMIYIYIYITR